MHFHFKYSFTKNLLLHTLTHTKSHNISINIYFKNVSYIQKVHSKILYGLIFMKKVTKTYISKIKLSCTFSCYKNVSLNRVLRENESLKYV